MPLYRKGALRGICLRRYNDMKQKTKILAAVAGVVTALGLVVHGLVPTAAELTQAEPVPAAIVSVQMEQAVTDTEPAEPVLQKKRSLTERLRAALLGLPQAVRILLALPLWAVGAAAAALGSALWTALGSVWGGIVGFLVLVVLLVAGYAFGAKCLFPDKPLREILKPRSVCGIAVLAAVLIALDKLLPLFVEKYPVWRAAMGALCVAVLFLLLYLRLGKNKRQKRKPA